MYFPVSEQLVCCESAHSTLRLITLQTPKIIPTRDSCFNPLLRISHGQKQVKNFEEAGGTLDTKMFTLLVTKHPQNSGFLQLCTSIVPFLPLTPLFTRPQPQWLSFIFISLPSYFCLSRFGPSPHSFRSQLKCLFLREAFLDSLV